MKPLDVIENVTDAETWNDAIWINQELKVFFVPIWRCGNTTFMEDVATKLNFELVKHTDVTDYYGIAFIRNPRKRLPSQIWIAHKHRGVPIQTLIENLNNTLPLDEHFIKQTDFLTGYNIDCYIDLDNLSNDYDNPVVNGIVEIMHISRRHAVDDDSRRSITDIINDQANHEIIETYITLDMLMWKENTK
tara:strand:+ start:6539 stop:7108 length:570 start_codon:yes stop_codon:yes gene_type:complete